MHLLVSSRPILPAPPVIRIFILISPSLAEFEECISLDDRFGIT
jgi:hypothetical protein